MAWGGSNEKAFIGFVNENNLPIPLDESLLEESDTLKKGTYETKNNILGIDGEDIKKKTKIVIPKDLKKAEKILGKSVFKVKIKGGTTVVFSFDDVKKVK